MLIYIIWPIALALLPIALKVKRKRFALLWIIMSYIISAFVIAIGPPLLNMVETGQGDPVLVAGQISESLTASLLMMVIIIPLALLMFWSFVKAMQKR